MPRLPALPSRRLPIEVAKRFANTASHERPRELETSEPEPGYFRVRFVRNGAWVPAIIWRGACVLTDGARGPDDQRWRMPPLHARPLRARIGDDEVDPLVVWEKRRRAITAQTYRFMLEDRAWVVQHAPDEPEGNPRAPADLAKRPSLF
jgi:hypothetical protein